jgi:hypothetical protein
MCISYLRTFAISFTMLLLSSSDHPSAATDNCRDGPGDCEISGTAQAKGMVGKERPVHGIVFSVIHFYYFGIQATALDLTDVVIACPSGSAKIGNPHYHMSLAGAVKCLPGDNADFTAVITDKLAFGGTKIRCSAEEE